MSNAPNYNPDQYVRAADFTAGAAVSLSAVHDTNGLLHYPGLVNPGSATYTFAGMAVTSTLNRPFAVLTGGGVLVYPHGTSTNADTLTYTTDFTPLVPSSTPVTAYLAATVTTIQQQPLTIVGPPLGHPSYNPNFAPYTGYQLNVETLVLAATLTVPDNVTTFELGRTTLVAGQTTITTLDVSHIVQASSLLAPTGVTPGPYTFSSITVNAAGQITAAGNGAPTGRLLDIRVFATVGIATYTPTAGTNMVRLRVQGGGGSGAGSPGIGTGTTQGAGEGGGGAGGYAESLLAVGSVSGLTLTIGAGGAAPAAGAAGNSGGASSVGSLITAAGGNGGQFGSPSTNASLNPGGSGGTASGGSLINKRGASGLTGMWINGYLVSGAGGDSLFGGGGFPVGGSGSYLGQAGQAGTGYGSGGSGASCNSTGSASPGYAGGAGASGVIFIEEFS